MMDQMDQSEREKIRRIVEEVLSRLECPAPPAQAGPEAGSKPEAAPPACPVSTPREGRGEGIPVEASARHVHLTREALALLFGPEASLGQRRPLSQPGEFLSDKKVTLAGPKGHIDHVAVLGPLRGAVQVELSLTDAKALGIDPPLRLSGDLRGAASVDIHGPRGSLKNQAAGIIAKRHLHLRPSDAARYHVRDREDLRVRVQTARPVIFDEVTVRVSEHFMPALHLDFDEANACMLQPGICAEILGSGCPSGDSTPSGAAPRSPEPGGGRRAPRGLITEKDAQRLVREGGETIDVPPGTIVTPAAKDVFLHARRQVKFGGDPESMLAAGER